MVYCPPPHDQAKVSDSRDHVDHGQIRALIKTVAQTAHSLTVMNEELLGAARRGLVAAAGLIEVADTAREMLDRLEGLQRASASLHAAAAGADSAETIEAYQKRRIPFRTEHGRVVVLSESDARTWSHAPACRCPEHFRETGD